MCFVTVNQQYFDFLLKVIGKLFDSVTLARASHEEEEEDIFCPEVDAAIKFTSEEIGNYGYEDNSEYDRIRDLLSEIYRETYANVFVDKTFRFGCRNSNIQAT